MLTVRLLLHISCSHDMEVYIRQENGRTCFHASLLGKHHILFFSTNVFSLL